MQTPPPPPQWALDAIATPDASDYEAVSSDTFLDDLLSFIGQTELQQQLQPHVAPPPTPLSSATDDSTSSDAHSDCSDHSPRIATQSRPSPLQPSRPSRGARGSHAKRTLELLRSEANQLTEQLDRLRADAAAKRSCAMQVAVAERFKRRRAEQECQELREAIYSQTRFIRGLQSVFSAPPCFSASLNLCLFLHNYTRLPRDQSTRWTEYAALAQDTRLRAAKDVVERETLCITTSNADGDQGVRASVSRPFIQTEILPDAHGFSVTTMSVYAVETKDVAAVVRGTCVATRDIVAKCQSYKCTDLKRQLIDPAASSSPALTSAVSGSNIMYRVIGIHHKSLCDSDELAVESRIVTTYKETDDYSIVLWDFVDDDELHPIEATTDIIRQAIGACLLRRELCDDGVERVVYRSLNTRRYRYNASAPHGATHRFHLSNERTMEENELTFRGLLVDQVTKEQAAYANALRWIR